MHPITRPSLGLLLAGALVVAAAVPALAADPKGNNGTVKIANVDIDSIPDNSPHQSCSFYVQFYGYDAAPAEAIATFTLVLPNGAETTLKTESNIAIGGDPASGAGTASGWDAARSVSLDGLLAPDALAAASSPNQGLHVRLSVQAPGSIGSDSKSKVFWVSGCLPILPQEQ